jgi:UDP-N-acetylmuramate: L-alanyl-gamma-D-glutamyl-meso-diaminopimelate ligase
VIVLGGLFHPERYTAETALDPYALVAALEAHGRRAMHEPDPDAIVEGLRTTTVAGDVIMIMSNGGFGGIHQKLLAALSERDTGAASG